MAAAAGLPPWQKKYMNDKHVPTNRARGATVFHYPESRKTDHTTCSLQRHFSVSALTSMLRSRQKKGAMLKLHFPNIFTKMPRSIEAIMIKKINENNK
jgi:hypothetical protein